ncbi:MAG TPA: response regulator transcription factor [Ruminococcus sp.]
MRILIIEDDKKQSYVLQFQLEKEGYAADVCYDGEDAGFFLSQNAYDVVLLDRMLPHKDGLTILREMRESGNTTPVILLTALGELNDRITGLDCGADDYLVKPFAFGELMARIRCILRRPSELKCLDLIQLGDITYKRDENVLIGKKSCCTLSQKEGRLLELFLKNPDQILSRHVILTRIWGAEYEIEEGNLDNYIYFVRRRLKNTGSSLEIKTIRGVGYLLSTEEKADV